MQSSSTSPAVVLGVLEEGMQVRHSARSCAGFSAVQGLVAAAVWELLAGNKPSLAWQLCRKHQGTLF